MAASNQSVVGLCHERSRLVVFPEDASVARVTHANQALQQEFRGWTIVALGVAQERFCMIVQRSGEHVSAPRCALVMVDPDGYRVAWLDSHLSRRQLESLFHGATVRAGPDSTIVVTPDLADELILDVGVDGDSVTVRNVRQRSLRERLEEPPEESDERMLRQFRASPDELFVDPSGVVKFAPRRWSRPRIVLWSLDVPRWQALEECPYVALDMAQHPVPVVLTR